MAPRTSPWRTIGIPSRYRFSFDSGEDWHSYHQWFAIYENYYAKEFDIPYKPINKTNTFPEPPVGWMTWYSVKFDASEATVLRNTRWQSEHLRDYGANCIWVDWEWYHGDFLGVGEPGVDTFNPSTKRYPHGLKYISDAIRESGLIPALWIGATNDPGKNPMLQKHPEWILANSKEWCGQWWLDLSHPGTIREYIPAVFRQILDWGFEAIKWDCIPTTLSILDQHHASFHDPKQSSEEAFRQAVKAARATIGDNHYLLLCAGVNHRTLTFAMDLFDAARIGGDVFNWNEFLAASVARFARYQCFHNVVWYDDLDNVVLREEFNDIEQARSRATFVSLAGVPFTLGDDLPELDAGRVDILKRTIPVLDCHPMDIRSTTIDLATVILNQSIARRFENWNVVDVFNTTGAEKQVRIDLAGDLHLETGAGIQYVVYDFWGKRALGVRDAFVDLTLPPHGSKVLSDTQAAPPPADRVDLPARVPRRGGPARGGMG